MKPVVSPVRPIPGASTRQGAAAEAERKRSQRVLLRVRANIHVALKGKATTLQTSTITVHPQGALVVLKENLPVETRLVLEHGATKEKIACRVSKQAKEMPEGFHVPVEFDSPAPGFWKIVFPPQDWHPEET
jgi:hypothetical protein